MSPARSVEPIAAALYHHTSGEEALHRDELRAAARAAGFTAVLEVDDTGTDRSGLLRVLEAARRGQITAVFVLRLDQLGDSATAVLETIRLLRDARCQLVLSSPGLRVPVEGEVSNALVAMLSAVSELEREVSRRRTQRRVDSTRRAGKKFGPPPGKNAPDPACVRDMRQKGCSWGQIARRLRCTREEARRAFARAR